MAQFVRKPAATGPKPVYFENEQDVNVYYPPVNPRRRGLKMGGAREVDRRAQADAYEAEQKDVIRKAVAEHNRKVWLEKSIKALPGRLAKRQAEIAELEYAEAGKVLLEQRRERLRAVLDSEYNAQVAELAKLGLAIAP